jgi:NAD-dependent SIR2 family protein deacetylase
MTDRANFERAVHSLRSAEALLIGAGAGMGVDSGLPDFRGTAGFWRAYPPYQKLGLSFEALADPHWFHADPSLAWGFYGHRRNLYRATQPHDGFSILRSWAERMKHGSFVFTSNVDGQFQRAGFAPDVVMEAHGSIDWMQCTANCGMGIHEAGPGAIDLDPETLRARPPFPTCPACRTLARPNILMFGDWNWDGSRTAEQEARLHSWIDATRAKRVVVVECGAGTAIPTVRRLCEAVAGDVAGSLIRINPRDPAVPPGQIGIALEALAALQAIDRIMQG